jgi:hypothetical protein
MIKKLSSLTVLCLIVIGSINVVTLNKNVFNDIGKTITTKTVAEIPSEVFSDVIQHDWKFVQ